MSRQRYEYSTNEVIGEIAIIQAATEYSKGGWRLVSTVPNHVPGFAPTTILIFERPLPPEYKQVRVPIDPWPKPNRGPVIEAAYEQGLDGWDVLAILPGPSRPYVDVVFKR